MMFEEERKVAGLNLNFRSDFENRLKTNPFLANVTCGICLCALRNAAEGADVLFLKAIFVAVNNNVAWTDVEGEARLFPCGKSSCIDVILSILYQLENEPGVFRVDVGRKAADMLAISKD